MRGGQTSGGEKGYKDVQSTANLPQGRIHKMWLEGANGGAWGRSALSAEVERQRRKSSRVDRHRREDQGAEAVKGCGVCGGVSPPHRRGVCRGGYAPSPDF